MARSFLILLSVLLSLGDLILPTLCSHVPKHKYDNKDTAKVDYVADILLSMVCQNGSQDLLKSILKNKGCSADKKKDFERAVCFLERLPPKELAIIERKIQYHSEAITYLSDGVAGCEGSQRLMHQEFQSCLKSSQIIERQDSLTSSKIVIKIISEMEGVDSSDYFKSSCKSIKNVLSHDDGSSSSDSNSSGSGSSEESHSHSSGH